MKPKAPTTTNGYITEANNNSSSPPTSPSRHSSLPHWRRRLQICKSQHANRRRGGYIPGIFLRRKLIRYLLLLPLLYVSVVITCAGPLSAILYPPQPGSVYRSHKVFQRLWPQIQADNSSSIELSGLWKYKRKLKEQKSCLNRTAVQCLDYVPDRYLMVEANGGLNQQRSSICNAVALAGLLNATLVIPDFDYHNVWKDQSKFRDIYDEDHFISVLEGHVKVVRDLPKEVIEKYDFNVSNIPELRVPAWSPASYYMEDVYTVLYNQGVIRISPFANRLAMNLPPYIQSLRCLANYKALRFSLPISTLARKLVDRIIGRSSSTGGKYVSVHLRFEEDMVAFSCCVYDGGKLEKSELDKIRESGWHGKFTHKDRIIDPGLNRIHGKCPMTPLEHRLE